jgi:homeobox-leucine zipper protein
MIPIVFFIADRACGTRFFQRGIDMNRVPAAVTDCDDETGVSSPNSTLSSLSGKRSEREQIGEETEAERASCSRDSDDEDGAGGDASRKKLRLSKEQSLVLEETFKEHNTLNPVSSFLFIYFFYRVRVVFNSGFGVIW